jgi:hypothetical protein
MNFAERVCDDISWIDVTKDTVLWLVMIINCVEQSPSWEANSRSASQEILSLCLTHKFVTALLTARHWVLS